MRLKSAQVSEFPTNSDFFTTQSKCFLEITPQGSIKKSSHSAEAQSLIRLFPSHVEHSKPTTQKCNETKISPDDHDKG
jgi:hypothetical protein